MNKEKLVILVVLLTVVSGTGGYFIGQNSAESNYADQIGKPSKALAEYDRELAEKRKQRQQTDAAALEHKSQLRDPNLP